MRRVLMVSFQFPPMAGSSGVQRALRFAQQLPALGWSPSVLTAHPRAHAHTGDDLLEEIPPELPVRRAFALDAARHLSIGGRYPGFLARPDRWHSWLLGAVPAGLRLIRQTRPDAIWSTYPIPTAHLVGYWLSRLSGLPWVADFRDPMAHDGYPADPVLWRSFAAVERKVFARAARCTFTTPGAARLYAQRFPAAADRLRVIENGYSEAAFQQAERAVRMEGANASSSATASTTAGPRVLLHSGVVYPDWRSPARLFEALAAAKVAGRVDAARLRLRLRATAHDDFVLALARRLDVADLVEVAPPLPYADALAEMLRADALLLLQSNDCNDQIPAKAYEYLRARRPVLTLADLAGDTAQLMRRAGLPRIAALEDGPGVAAVLDRFLDDLFHGRAALPAASAIAAASRESRTGELARVLDEACAPQMPTAEARP
ncbi:glycosyltransferase involved in cell wall biosynthesis [Mitsuaria sp. BK045]|uniref:glycosyltransferase n=1 Tax=unclassified Roseateles TaxID=2626991 RepID=UPI001609AA1C|nr:MULTISPECIES: glycosyltransferase [unclassified Roseateles]MBB3294082.1 glycosyltransferase involved in cell wall biosynthesis [Mitsuaria sp. BK041]MBB3363299.1 glycosyltransferase involved in cell wall biosynthesis [Mitsuaria sp. BK045]